MFSDRMERSHDIAKEINASLLLAAQQVPELTDEFDPQIRGADPRFGDFQANGTLPFAKRHGHNPRALGEKLMEAMPPHDDWNVSLAGPGFINFKLSESCLLRWLSDFSERAQVEQSMAAKERKHVVLDFSSPNTAKQMHVGHIRSTIIGESLSRLMKLNGHKVTKDNHLGDWGTQFGILLYAIKREGIDLDSLGDEPVARLEDLYRMGNQWIKDDKQALEEAREELVKLQKGDEENLSLWQKIRDLSMDSFEQVYRLLGVSFDYAHGESFYRDQVEEVYTSLGQHNICQEDAGALVVFHPEHKRFAKQPFIIRKSDGASNYATTDLATLNFRAKEWQSDQIIYVTDGRQRDHFEQLFLTAQKWFNADSKNLPTLSHVWFGTILGEDNKAIKTRDGQPIKLVDLLAEAIRRASEMVREKNPDLPEAEMNRRAQVIGLGAVKYADLSQDRTLDYVFSWEKLLAMQGNTAPYLQYAVARVCSIFRKIEGDPEEFIGQARKPKTEAEKKLARKLIFFPLAIEQATRELKPHFLCTYLYELATEFSSFYNQDKVMVPEPEAQGLRLLLCKTTQTYLQTGLEMLGIETLEEM